MDKRQAKREARREKKREKRGKQNFKMFIGLAAAMGNNKSTSGNKFSVVDSSRKSDSESDLSSVQSTDSPPAKRAKLNKDKKRPAEKQKAVQALGTIKWLLNACASNYFILFMSCELSLLAPVQNMSIDNVIQSNSSKPNVAQQMHQL